MKRVTMQVNIAQAKARLSELVQKAMMGEEIVIAKDNKPLLRLTPITTPIGERKPGSGKAQVLSISDDFDAPLDAFDGYK
jgi:prevent-host-death family protein